VDLIDTTLFLAILVLTLVLVGRVIARTVPNSDNPYIASVMWPLCGAAVPAIWFYVAQSGKFLGFSSAWPLVYAIFFLPTAGSAIVFSWLSQRRNRKKRG